jgi:undecaprenyl-diphosphatase
MLKNIYFKLSLISLILFVLLSLSILVFPLQQTDIVSINFIQKITPYWIDDLLAWFSVIGNFEIIFIPFIILVILFKQNRSRFFIFFTFFLGLLIEVISKYFFYHPGPPIRYFRNNLHILLPTSRVILNYSYPSGHSFRFTFIFIILAYYLIFIKKCSKTLAYTLGLLLLIILFSRVSLGEHWLSDVLGGGLLGASFAFLSLGLIDKKTPSSLKQTK